MTINPFTKKTLSCLFAAIFFCVLWLASAAYGKPFRIGIIPENGRSFGCAACHTSPSGGGKLNPFGMDYAKHGISAGEKYTEKLDKLDSDKDGFTNGQEFKAKTYPGNADSKPESGK